MKRVLVISPSGEIYEHDNVRWYGALGFKTHPNHYHNIGDAFVYDSSLKLLDFRSIETLNIRDATDADIQNYNENFDYAFLRGSNYLHSEMDWENAPEILSKLTIPIIAFGIGAQASSKAPLSLSRASIRVLSIISEKSVSLGVRGTYTADVLWSLGIKNVRVVACPTIFRNNDPDLRINLPALSNIKNVAYTLRREVDVTYAQDMLQYLALQRSTILDLDREFNVEVLAQGEVAEKNLLWGSLVQRQNAIETLRQDGWLKGTEDRLEEIYSEKLFYSDCVREFEVKIRAQQLVLGYRLHGNLLALANRIPSIYFTYDTRTAEFAETLQIPHFDVFSKKKFELENFWDQALFEKFNRAYYQTYRSMRSFLNENGVANKMLDEPSSIPVSGLAE